ncbi:MAG: hypothetical protein L6Q76_35235, partial [Polyangiaceae bacterium]|nr:hypothetical protein [Polyangiaceae bacterium]
LPGEGTGVYGVDPMVFLEPGDNNEVDKLLKDMRTECDEGDPFFVDYRKHKGRLKAPANTQSKAGENTAKETRGEAATRKGWMSSRWLGYAMVAIVGPVVALLLGLLLSTKSEMPEESIAKAGTAPGPAASSAPTAAPAESASIPPRVGSNSGADTLPAVGTGAPSASGGRTSPVRSSSRKVEDPYDIPPVAAPSVGPSVSPAQPSASPSMPPVPAMGQSQPEF